jgi:hypothetical protein
LDGDGGRISNALRCAVRRVPLEQPTESGVRPEVRVPTWNRNGQP